MPESSSLGSSVASSREYSGKAAQSAGFRVFRRKEDFSHEMEIVRSPPSKVTAASSSVFTMLVSILPETTVSPDSSTFAGMRWRIVIVRLLVWNSRVPSSALM